MVKTSASVKIESHKKEFTDEMLQKVESWLNAVGLDAASTAAQQVPVDTGRLKNSISHAVVKEEKTVYIGTNVEYAPYHEFGTGKYSEDGTGRKEPWAYQDQNGEWHRTSGVPARHFLQFGITAHQQDYEQMLKNTLQ